MTDYDPRTSYATDHELMDLQEDADWEPNNQDLDALDDDYRDPINGIVIREIADVKNPDYISATLGVALSPTTKVFVLWNPTDQDFDVLVNDVIATTEAESHDPGRWLVSNVTESPFSHTVVIVNQVIENVED